MADAILEQIADFIKPLRLKPGSQVTLAKDFDPRYKAGFVNKKAGQSFLRQGVDLLAEYQTRLAAQGPTASWCASRPSTRRARTEPSATS